MEESILKTIKKLIGLAEGYTVYDEDVKVFINGAISTLTQLGIGPSAGFMIEDATTTWGAFVGDDPRLSAVKTYIHLRLKLIFDPPQTSFAITAFEKQIEELAWRLNVVREEDSWVDPTLA